MRTGWLLLVLFSVPAISSCDSTVPAEDVEIGALEVRFGCAFVDMPELAAGETRTVQFGTTSTRANAPCLLTDFLDGRYRTEPEPVDPREDIELYLLRVERRSAVRLAVPQSDFFGTVALFGEDGTLVASASLDDLDGRPPYRGGLTRTLESGVYVAAAIALSGSGEYDLLAEVSTNANALTVGCPGVEAPVLPDGERVSFGVTALDCTVGSTGPYATLGDAETSYAKYFQVEHDGGTLRIGARPNMDSVRCPQLQLLSAMGSEIQPDNMASDGCAQSLLFGVPAGTYTARVINVFEPTPADGYSILYGR
ncbi:MAG: hypothetical protein AAGK21_15940 [Bacteroidota bacterium]